MFYFVRNLTKQSMETGLAPWDFVTTEEITDSIRKDKQSRQKWYQTQTTSHHFYTALEPANPNMRPGKDNPVRAIHAFTADYDVKIPRERVIEAIAAMRFKPQYIERSLGGNVRLIWLLPRPLMTETNEFATFILDKAMRWLDLELLPGLDAGAFVTSTRLLCNGGKENWEPLTNPKIPESELQAFFVACGKSFRFKSTDATLVPLDVVEAEIKKRYPNFNWPSDFTAESQGPTFWVPESTSPMSAILKPEGFITFSAHAAKPFYSWSDILGAEFVRQFAVETIAKATTDIWWDQKKFWRKKTAGYVSMEAAELTNYLKVNCRIATKPGPDGNSPMDNALNHIYNVNDIIGAAPFVMQPSGIIHYMGKRVLNTYVNRVMKPSEGPAGTWGEHFPFLAAWLDAIFDPTGQLPHFLAWLKYFYLAALNDKPLPGQNIFLMGGAGVGKTLLNRVVIGGMLGSFVDAASHLIAGAQFNSEMHETALWCVDDETASESESSRANFQAMLKKSTANSTFKYHKKFEIPVMVDWTGRIICSSNLDYVSTRLLGSMDNTSMDKTCLFRCSKESKIVFPDRELLLEIIKRELPHFLRWLVEWPVPANIKTNSRYGYDSYHDPALLDQAHQGGRSSPFKEVLVESLLEYFEQHPTEKNWSGTATKVIRLMMMNPLNEAILRSVRLEQTSRYMEQIQREGLLPCTVGTGDFKERLWIFERPQKTTNNT